LSAYLLDTHAILWWWLDDPHLGARARQVIEDGDDRICVSVASIWEIAIKSQAGRLPEMPAFDIEYPGLIGANHFDLLNITDHHAMRAAYFKSIHRDPFDRLIGGQALCEGLTVVTRDREFAAFGCEVLW